jgi:hypothetical protein
MDKDIIFIDCMARLHCQHLKMVDILDVPN